jgi:8-oxo-dGTP pyrophosphatase MutT (NUDIX family)/phosphohistidine phosphatase SixA
VAEAVRVSDGYRLVPAAGGVVWRVGAAGVEVLLVHRPRYDDWSLPKGKLDPGESALAAAVREVYEETGVHAVPQLGLPEIRYLTGVPGVEKSVSYWTMRAARDDGREPDDEVDALCWLSPAAARDELTYAHDRGVLAAAVPLLPLTGLVVLLRHARAGSRQGWAGPDALRPLDRAGRRQAGALASLLTLYRPGRVVSATPRRCRDTVAPLAAAAGLPVEVDEVFDEYEPPRPQEVAAALRRLGSAGEASTVVCGQGGSITPTLPRLTPGDATATARYETPKGGGWVLGFAGENLVAAQRLDVAAD